MIDRERFIQARHFCLEPVRSVGKMPIGELSLSGKPECLSLQGVILTDGAKTGKRIVQKYLYAPTSEKGGPFLPIPSKAMGLLGRFVEANDVQSLGYYTPHYLHILSEGDAQPQIHVQLPSAMIDFQKNAQQAVSASRWCRGCFRGKPGRRGPELRGQAEIGEYLIRDITEAVVLEESFPAFTLLALDLLGHCAIVGKPWKDGIGHAQILVIQILIF